MKPEDARNGRCNGHPPYGLLRLLDQLVCYMGAPRSWHLSTTNPAIVDANGHRSRPLDGLARNHSMRLLDVTRHPFSRIDMATGYKQCRCTYSNLSNIPDQDIYVGFVTRSTTEACPGFKFHHLSHANPIQSSSSKMHAS
jgi:hypothetical protein